MSAQINCQVLTSRLPKARGSTQLVAIVFVLLVASVGSAYGSESAATTDKSGSTDREKSASAAPTTAAPTTVLQGFGLFQQRCLSCHGNPAFKEAPSPEALREMTPEHVFEVLSTGAMYPVVGKSLSDDERRAVAESITGQLMGTSRSGAAASMPNQCPTQSTMADPAAGPAWNGWGAGPENRRFQSTTAAGLSADTIGQLQLKWAFGFPGGTSAYGQPAVVSGRVFVGTDTGWVYSLDAITGCIHWSFKSQAGVRAAVSIGSVHDHGKVNYVAYFGDQNSNVYAVDAISGTPIWRRKVEAHYASRITAAPALYRKRLYVPISSWEEFSARSPDVECCTSVGAVVALDADSGREVWKTYMIPERPRVVGKNSHGVRRWAPAGGSVWNTPTIDSKRQTLYVGTGDATTFPAAATTDAVIAIRLVDGRILWSHQVHHSDSYLVGCEGAARTDNCPKVQGPDWDIPASPVLHTLAGGRDELIIGTKPGDILALDPASKGAQLWRVNLSGSVLANDGPIKAGNLPSGVLWGFADDGERAYFGLIGGGLVALDIANHAVSWRAPLSANPTASIDFTPSSSWISHGTAATAIPGAVFIGGSDGKLFAVSSTDGRELWSFDTARSFTTVNDVAAHGGSFGAPGPAVAGGMLFIGSGYSGRGMPGNVLLAFSTQ
jgi:polyvinyl alcohol dehydrogenase (cytochrome)